MKKLLSEAARLGIDPNNLPDGYKTLEQAVDMEGWKQALGRKNQEYINTLNTKADVESATATYKAGKPVAPKKPNITYSIYPFENRLKMEKYNKEKAEYDKQLDAYNRALKLLGKDK